MRVEDLLKYSGKNGDYYKKYLERFELNEDFFSWNWMAFFFFPFWLLYRKLWKQFSILILLSIFINFVVFSMTYFYTTDFVVFSTTYFYSEVSSLRHVDQFYYPILILVGSFIVSIVYFPLFLSSNANYLKKAKKAIENGDFKEGEGRSIKAVYIYTFFLVIFIGFNVWTFMENEKSLNTLSDKTTELNDNVKSKFEILQKELETFTYNSEWEKMKVVLQEHSDLTQLSEVDYMFRVIKSLIEHEEVELLEMMMDKNLSLSKITEVSGRDFVEYAYTEKKWKVLKLLMTKGEGIFEKRRWMKEDTYTDKRPLQLVVESKDVETLQWLIEKGIPVKAKFYKGDSPLMLAVQAESLEMIKVLVKAGAKPNYRNLKGDSAIAYSQKSKSSEIRAYFDAKVSASTFSIRILNEAIKKEDLVLIKRIVESGIDVKQKAKTHWGKLPLEVAIDQKNVEILDYLLSNGVDINQDINEQGERALYSMVSASNALELMKCALKHGAEVNSTTISYNALDKSFAPRADWLDRAKLLIEHNASLTTPINNQNQLAIHAALEHEDNALINLIIDKMVKEGHSKFLSSQDENGDSPLNYAVWNNKLDIVKKLLKLGVNTKDMNKRKVQAISYATTKELLEVLKPHSTHKPSISDSYCMVYVLKEFNKSMLSHCQTTAEYYESTKEHTQSIWYYFLANDLESIKRYSQDMKWIKDCNCHGYRTYMDIAHAYLLNDDIKNAKKHYITLAEFSKYENARRWMKRRFETLEGLHPGYGKKAKKLWHEVWKEKYKQNFFEVYDVGVKLN